jgi:hypothetical protein
MNNCRTIVVLATSLLTLVLALSGCSHESAFQKQRTKCHKLTEESERSSCLEKVAADESAYERKHNETRIEKNYKRKLEDMKN